MAKLHLVQAFSTSASPDSYLSERSVVVTETGLIYQIFVDNGNTQDLFYCKSLDGGRTWQPRVLLATGAYTGGPGPCVWYDRWTPGDAGTLIHVWACEFGADDITYLNLDTANDAIVGPVTVFNGASLGSGSTMISGTKARGGNLYVVFDGDAGTETGFYRSTDGGVNWTSRSNTVNEAGTDYYLLVPGNAADNQDIECVFWDTSANELSLKSYADTGDAWTEVSIATSMTDVSIGTIRPQFAVIIRPSDNHLLVAAWNLRDNASARLRTWEINGAASITAKTDILTNADDSHGVALCCDAANNVWAYYLGKEDGSQTLAASQSAIGVYGKLSRDGMATWGSEITLHSLLLSWHGIWTTLLALRETPYPFLWANTNVGNTHDQMAGQVDAIYTAIPTNKRAILL